MGRSRVLMSQFAKTGRGRPRFDWRGQFFAAGAIRFWLSPALALARTGGLSSALTLAVQSYLSAVCGAVSRTWVEPSGRRLGTRARAHDIQEPRARAIF